jgi:hypothetical protein
MSGYDCVFRATCAPVPLAELEGRRAYPTALLDIVVRTCDGPIIPSCGCDRMENFTVRRIIALYGFVVKSWSSKSNSIDNLELFSVPLDKNEAESTVAMSDSVSFCTRFRRLRTPESTSISCCFARDLLEDVSFSLCWGDTNCVFCSRTCYKL